MDKNLYVTPDRYTGEIGDIDPVDTPHFQSTHYHFDLQKQFRFEEDDRQVVTVNLQLSISQGSSVTIDYESNDDAQARDGMQQIREKQLVRDLISDVHKATVYLTQEGTGLHRTSRH